MKKSMIRLLFVAITFVIVGSLSFGQGTTTAAMNGRVVDDQGNPLPGATVVAIHEPTGSQFGGITDSEGYFRLPNMNIGGPYSVTFSFVGYQKVEKKGIYLTLGQTYKLNVVMKTSTTQLAEVAVTGKRVSYNEFDGNKTGAQTMVNSEQISMMPTVERSIADMARLTPQAAVDDNGAISVAGINNRFNAISIDGAVNNDVFGLSPTGTNGGQTGGSPVSMDAIEQFQIVLAPYDVRQSGFAGASINAVTRSGSNDVKASVYYYMRNENLAGKTPTSDESVTREKLPDFTSATYGARVGGAIVKNKLFYFVSAELGRDQTPKPFSFSDYDGNSSQSQIDAIAEKLRNFGYEPGPYLNKKASLNSDKLFARIDWNISQHHKLMLRHSYTFLEAKKVGASSSRALSFENNSQYFPSKTNSTSLELKSNYNTFSNSLILGYTSVLDDRDPLGGNFPSLTIYDGSATIYAGSEPYSTANQLKQGVMTITDNFNIYKGKHTFTFGANIELSHTYNLFMRKNFGEYRYSSVADFLTVKGQGFADTIGVASAYQYERGYSLVDEITGDGSAAAADFSMLQWGIYAQDEIQVNENFKLTAGLRVDMPVFLQDPKEDTHFNSETVPVIEGAGWDMYGASAGKMPKSKLLFSPRFGFNWDVSGDESFQVRGGTGIFTSRLPLVWPGGSYTNNGLTIGGVYVRNTWGYYIPFESRWDHQYKNSDFGETDAPYGGQMDLFAANYKFPQVARTDLAFDKKIFGGMVLTVEGIFTKTLNNVLYYNMNVSPTPDFYLTGADNRPHYDNSKLDPSYTRVMVGTNASKGYSYNFTIQLQKNFSKGFTGSLAYTYGRAMSVNDGTSSQNSSQWRYMEQVNGLNNLDLSISDFDLGSRIVGFLSYRLEYLKHMATTISLFYNGQSGQRYSYVYRDRGNLNGNGESDNNLIYIPENQGEIVFADAATASQQWNDLDEFISNDPYLSKHRGEYAERNGSRTPFTNIFDLKIAQDIFTNIGTRKHTLQFTLDIFNFTNILNKNWGRRYYVPYGYYRLISFEGFDTDGTTPTFSFSKPHGDVWNVDDSGISSSRWQAQIGFRYLF
ncbi:MAG: carboxypeptidase regulatory-like domain-containing protein [Bacteroidales bacterium]|nr:carboxypeptidase regulatory-like domain-containing protein [Bacteroidales bacterium]